MSSLLSSLTDIEACTLYDSVLSWLRELDLRALSLRPASVTYASFAAAFVWAALRAFQRVRVKSLIRGLPGPTNPSWLTGKLLPRLLVHSLILTEIRR